LTSCFVGWRAFCRRRNDQQRHESNEAATVAALTEQLNAQKRARVQTLLQRWRMSTLTPFFLSWRTTVRSARLRKRELLGRFCRRLEQLQLHQSFRSWRLHVEHANVQALRSHIHAQKLARVQALITRWRLSSQTPFFLAWRSHTRAVRMHKRAVMDRVIRRLERLQVYTCLRQWHQQADAARQAEFAQRMQSSLNSEKAKRVQSLVARWRLSSLGPSFVAWARMAREGRERKRNLLEKSLQRLTNQLAFRAWRRWTGFVEAARVAQLHAALNQVADSLSLEKRKRAATIIAAWRARTVVPAFKEWRAAASASRSRKRDLLGRMLSRMTHHAVWSAWRVWTSFVDQSRTTAFNAQIAEHKRKRVVALVQRWRQASTTPVFLAWRTTAHNTRARKKMLLQRVLTRMERASLYRGFRQWRQSLDEQRVSELRTALTHHKRARAHAAIVAWRARSVTPTFHAWRSFARTRRARKHALLNNVLTKLALNGLYRAFGQWKHFNERSATRALVQQMEHHYAHLSAQVQAQKRKRYHAMLERWTPKSPQKMFRAWRVFARAQRDRKRLLLGKIIDRMSNLPKWRAWHAWQKFVDASKVAAVTGALQSQLSALRLKQVQAVMQRWRSRTAGPVFSAWRAYARVRRTRKRELLDMILKRLGNLQLYSAWRAWSSFARSSTLSDMKARFERHTSGLETVLAAQKQARIRALIMRWQTSSITHAFQAWQSMARARRVRKRELLAKVLARLAQQKVYRAWRSWTGFVEQSRVHDLRRKFAAAIDDTRDAHATQVAALKKQRIVQLVENWRRRGLTPTFAAWRHTARAQRQRKRDLLASVCRRLLHRELYLGWRQWTAFVEGSKLHAMRAQLNSEKSKRAQALIHRWTRASLVPTFQAWATFTRLQKADREARVARRSQLLDYVLRRLAQQHKYAAWRTWISVVEQARVGDVQARLESSRLSKRALAAQLLRRWTTQREADVFRAWRAQVRTSKRARAEAAVLRSAALGRVVGRSCAQAQLGALRLWRHRSAQQRLAELEEQAARQQGMQQQLDSDNAHLRSQLQEQLHIVAYLYRVIQNSV
jgi:hypothetical protein